MLACCALLMSWLGQKHSESYLVLLGCSACHYGKVSAMPTVLEEGENNYTENKSVFDMTTAEISSRSEILRFFVFYSIT